MTSLTRTNHISRYVRHHVNQHKFDFRFYNRLTLQYTQTHVRCFGKYTIGECGVTSSIRTHYKLQYGNVVRLICWIYRKIS